MAVMPFSKFLAFVFKYRYTPILGYAAGILYFRHFFFSIYCAGRRCTPPNIAIGKFWREFINAVCVYIKSVVAKFVIHPKQQQYANSKANRQPCNIDECIGFAFK